ncbi:MAG: alanine dehydrogenase [Puniceicoccaceae bacterium]|nr:MAG: alanine dehydrogenase [Puniceicoccaceae bacterium]
MVIGVPKEIKQGETRVAVVPSTCRRLVDGGNRVLVEAGAGAAAGFADEAYAEAGAALAPGAAVVFAEADLIVKVKEPQPAELEQFREGQALFTYLHLAAAPAVAQALCSRRVLGIGYETIEGPGGSLPVLKPMSQVAGRLSVQVGAWFLMSSQGGAGVLPGGVPGVERGHIVILGLGNAGSEACRMAVGLGARVTVLDIDRAKLEHLEERFPGLVNTLVSTPSRVAEAVAAADLVIGAVLVAGARAPRVVSREMVRSMAPRRVVVDIAIDQGGCVETIRPTSHKEPVYLEEGVLHYAVPNMPALVGRTATLALTQVTEPYLLRMAKDGIDAALEAVPGLEKGVNTRDGRVVHPAVAAALAAE